MKTTANTVVWQVWNSVSRNHVASFVEVRDAAELARSLNQSRGSGAPTFCVERSLIIAGRAI